MLDARKAHWRCRVNAEPHGVVRAEARPRTFHMKNKSKTITNRRKRHSMARRLKAWRRSRMAQQTNGGVRAHKRKKGRTGSIHMKLMLCVSKKHVQFHTLKWYCGRCRNFADHADEGHDGD